MMKYMRDYKGRLAPAGWVLVFVPVFMVLVFSCKSAPPQGEALGGAPPVRTETTPPEDEIPELSGPAGETTDGYAGTGEAVPEIPPEVTAPPIPVETEPEELEPEEPSADFPETAVPPAEPPERSIPALPDPPSLDPLPAPEPPVPDFPVPVVPPIREIPPPVVPAPGPAEPQSEAPEPPLFLRPPEPEITPPSRETVPVPLPDLPARTPVPVQEETIIFSRTVRATVGQLVEIPFRGTGWVYLGELGSRRGIAYDSRRLDPDGQTFIFRAETAGTYALKFYKQDFIRDYILNDYVKVIVGEAPESSGAGWFNPPVDRGRVTAEPRWPPAEHPSEPPPAAPLPETAAPPADDAIQPAPSAGTAVFPEASAQTPLSPPSRPVVTDDGIVPVVPPSVPQETTTPAIEGVRGSGMPEDAEPDEYVRRAKEEYDAGRVGPALAVLDRLKLRYPSLTDEALLLYGQLLESNSPSRDIRLALEYYRRLVREYPQSPLVPQAQRRIAYLERYYFTIQ